MGDLLVILAIVVVLCVAHGVWRLNTTWRLLDTWLYKTARLAAKASQEHYDA